MTVTYISDASATSTSTKTQLLRAGLAVVNQGMSGQPPFIRAAETSILTRKYRFIEFFVPGIIAMSVMTSSLSGAVTMNAELRQKGVIRKLSTTPITRTDWILSNILYQFVLAVISTGAILVVSYAVFIVRLQINAWLFVFLVLEVFAFGGIGMILTRVANEAESAAAAANFIMFPMMFLAGSFFPLEMMPGFLQTIARILPLYYVNEGLRASMVSVDNTAALALRRDDRDVRGRGLCLGCQHHQMGRGDVKGTRRHRARCLTGHGPDVRISVPRAPPSPVSLQVDPASSARAGTQDGNDDGRFGWEDCDGHRGVSGDRSGHRAQAGRGGLRRGRQLFQ